MEKERIIAFVIDMICIMLFNTFISLIMIFVIKNLLSDSIITSILMCVTIFCKDCYNGTSLGKKIMNIQIVDKKTLEPASPIKCTIRNLFYTIWFVEFIVFLFNKDRNRLGDYITKTIVTHGIKKAKNINWIQIIVSVLFISLLYLSIFYYLYCSFSLFRLLNASPA